MDIGRLNAASDQVRTQEWSSTGATSFTLQRSSVSSAGPWTTIASGSQTSYAETVPSGTYDYQVQASDAGGASAWTAGGPTVVHIPPPIASGGGGGGCDFAGGDAPASSLLPLGALALALMAARRWRQRRAGA